jgi:GalNAc-alpha-(1->4)-GalNAc-alpha-(1->3)-diNAcBac-PP-undecaprenol alpha-1,4-N-acetyl-D-galactosaminyltransferase
MNQARDIDQCLAPKKNWQGSIQDSEKSPRLAFVISSLSSGGAERVLSSMANYWAHKGWAITVITLANNDSDFYSLDDRISRIALGAAGQSRGILDALLKNLVRLVALRSAVRMAQPDVVVSFIDGINVLTLMATLFLRIPVVVAERVDPRWHMIGDVWNRLRTLLYPTAAALVVQTQDVFEWAVQKVGKNKAFVIPNPYVPNKPVCPVEQASFPGPFMLGVGRLEHQKGFDILLLAFSNVAAAHRDWSLVVLGEGRERNALQTLANSLGLEGRVRFPGEISNAAAVMEHASLFVLPSRYEGFPNVLLEAMAAGLPCVSFKCPSGPAAIIRDGIDGKLVPREDVAALGEAIKHLIGDENRRNSLGRAARAVTERFALERIMPMWERLLGDVKTQRR